MRTWHLTILVAALVGLGIGYHQHKKQQEQEAFNRRWQHTLQGSQVLKIPPTVQLDPLDTLLAIKPCQAGMWIAAHALCHGEGRLFGIPAYVDVERVDATHLHYVSYSLQLPAKPILIEHFTRLFGPAHQADRLPVGSAPPKEVCWPLPEGEAVVLESDDPTEAQPSVAVFLYSQVAANQWREMENIDDTCERLPLAKLPT